MTSRKSKVFIQQDPSRPTVKVGLYQEVLDYVDATYCLDDKRASYAEKFRCFVNDVRFNGRQPEVKQERRARSK